MEQLEIGPEEVEAMVGKNHHEVELVDVREEWELSRGILPGAIHVPLSTFQDYVSSFSPGREYVIYCEHGIRSLHVVEWLRAHRGIHAKSMRGGFAEWQGSVAEYNGGTSQ